jgi:hypothetical protein
LATWLLLGDGRENIADRSREGKMGITGRLQTKHSFTFGLLFDLCSASPNYGLSLINNDPQAKRPETIWHRSL